MKKSPLRGEYFIGAQLPGAPGQSWRVASRLAKNKGIRIVTQYNKQRLLMFILDLSFYPLCYLTLCLSAEVER